MDISLNLKRHEPEQGLGSISLAPILPGYVGAPMSPEAANNRAQHYDVALGDLSPGAETIASDLEIGDEQLYRDRAADAADERLRRQRIEEIQNLASDEAADQARLNMLISTGPDEANPATVLEEDYAANYLADIWFSNPEGPQTYEDLNDTEKRMYDIAYDTVHELVVRDEIIGRHYDMLSQRWAEQNTVTHIWDFIETMIPGKDWLTWSNELNAIPAYNDLRWPGDSLLQQIQYLNRLPPNQFEAAFSEAVNAIANVNMNQAFYFIQAVQAYTRSDQMWSNIFTGIDIATLPGTGFVLRGLGRIARVNRAATAADAGRATGRTEQVVEAAGEATPSPSRSHAEILEEGTDRLNQARQANARNEGTPSVRAAAGDVAGAVDTELAEEVAGAARRSFPRSASRRLMGVFNPSEMIGGIRNSFSVARNLLGRTPALMARLDRLSTEFVENEYNIARLTQGQTDAAVQEAEGQLRREMTAHVGNALIDIRRMSEDFAENNAANVDFITGVLGKPDGSGFTTAGQAGAFAKKYGLDDYQIKMENGFHYIHVKRSTDETQAARDFRIETRNETKSPFMGFLRSASDIQGDSIREGAKKLVHLQQRNAEILGSIKKMARVSRADRQDFIDFLEYMRDNQQFPGLRGKQFLPTAQLDFETAWKNVNGQLPTKAQSQAYWAWIRLHQIEWALKNFSVYRGKARQGVHSISINMPKSKLTVDFEGKYIENFNLDDIPGNQVVALYDRTTGVIDTYRIDKMTPQQRKIVENARQVANAETVRIFDRASRPLQKLGTNEVVDFIITTDVMRSPLRLEQIPFKPGGSVIVDHPMHIKQVRAGTIGAYQRNIKYGEALLSGADSITDAHVIAKAFNQALDLYRQAKKSGNFNTFTSFVQNNLPHVNPQDLINDIKSGRVSETGKVGVTRPGQTLDETNPQDADFTLPGYDTLDDNVGMGGGYIDSEIKPIYEMNASSRINPMAAIDRNLQAAIKSGPVADFVTKAAEHFVREFKDVLENNKYQLKGSPLSVLLAPKWNEAALNSKRLLMAKRYQKSIRDLLGYQSPLRQHMDTWGERIYNSIYGATGKKEWAQFGSDLFLGAIDEVPRFMRAVAFNMSMGFFNPYQLWKQAQTIFVSSAITGNPLRSMQSAGAAMIQLAYLKSARKGGMMQGFASAARKIGWDPKEFEEVTTLLENSGLSIIRGEHAFKDRWMDPPIVQSRWGKFLDHGTVFFKRGEQLVRLTALNIAYKEWRKANPTKAFRRLEQESVMRRADDLSVNMTHASNASWNKGALAIPTQFFSYQIRLMELFWGKRLNWKEKARLLMTQSILYGVPVGGAGMALGIFPLHDQIRTQLITNGVMGPGTDPSIATQILSEGIFGALAHAITGHDTNVSAEYGPGGIDLFVNMLTGDETFREIIFGVAGGKIGEIVQSAYPFIGQLRMWLGGQAPISLDSVASILRTVSTFTNAERAIYAMNTLAYLRKNGQIAIGSDRNGDGVLDDPRDRYMTSAEVGLLTLFGIDPAIVNDEFLLNAARADWSAMQQAPREQMMGEFRRMAEIVANPALSLQDKEEMIKPLWERIAGWSAMGGFTEPQIQDIMYEVFREGGGTAMLAYYNYLMTSTQADPNTQTERLERAAELPTQPNPMLTPERQQAVTQEMERIF